MKKIVLIDDNYDGSRRKYGADFVDEGLFNQILVSIEKLNIESSFVFLKTAACVLMHETFRDYYNNEFHEDSQKVKKIIRSNRELGESIPFVLFTDGYTSDIGDYNQDKPNFIYRLNKGVFYGRLYDFLHNYEQNKVIDLKLLAYGSNYETALVERLASIIFSRILDLDDNEILDASRIHCEEMRQFVKFAQPKIGKSYNEILVDIKLNQMKVGFFKLQINNILDSFQDYGQNCYCWK